MEFKREKILAQSIAVVDFIIVTIVAVNQALWLRKMLSDLYHKQKKEAKIFADNQAEIAISNSSLFHHKTKHFNIKPLS